MACSHAWRRAIMLFASLQLPLSVHAQDRGSGQSPGQQRLIASDEARADLRDLYAGLKEAQYDLYAHVSKDDMDRAFRVEHDALDAPITPLALQARYQRFVAKVRVAHTRIAFPTASYDAYLNAGGTIFPIDVRIDSGRVFVVANKSDQAAPAVGDEITRLDGMRTAVWLSRLARQVSADTPYLANTIVEYRLPAYLWIEQGRKQSYAITVRQPDGQRRDLVVPARTKEQIEASAKRLPPRFSLDDVRVAKVLPGGIAYLRPGPFYNAEHGENAWDTTAFRQFIDDAFGRFIAADTKQLLIDLRSNPGGDSSFSDPMIAWFADRPFRFVADFRIRVSRQTVASNRRRIEAASKAGVADPVSPKFADLYRGAKPGSVVSFEVPLVSPREGARFKGKVYVLIDRYSYSNTVSVAAIVQDYGFGTILGEETADLATTYGAMETFDLPRTGVTIGYAKAFLIRPSGSLLPRGVVPDIAIRTPIAAEKDVVLETALEKVRSGRGRGAYRHASR